MNKKLFSLLVSLIFVFSLGIAHAGEENAMPWDQPGQAPAKKEDKTKEKAKVTKKKDAAKSDVKKAGKPDAKKAAKTAKGGKASAKKAEQKEPEKKWYVFW